VGTVAVTGGLLPTIEVSKTTHTRLLKLKGILMTKKQKKITFDEAIEELLNHYKKTTGEDV
jgi:hypothetical protein